MSSATAVPVEHAVLAARTSARFWPMPPASAISFAIRSRARPEPYLMPLRRRLAVALIQLLTKRSAVLARRIESFVTDNAERRLARTLIYFSERLGFTMEDGSTQTIPLSHKMLAQYIGTTRENVTQLMIQFRSRGFVRVLAA